MDNQVIAVDFDLFGLEEAFYLRFAVSSLNSDTDGELENQGKGLTWHEHSITNLA